MKHVWLTALVLVLGVAIPADGQDDEAFEKQVAEFRLKKDPKAAVRGWIVAIDDEGFKFQRFAGGRMDILWDDLVAEDATRLRREFRLELTEDEKAGVIPGHELHFRGGGTRRGLLVSIEKDGTHRLRENGLILPYPGDRIDRVEEVKVKEAEVFAADEIYIRRLQRRPPQNARDHARLADYLYDIGNWDAAEAEYHAAIEKQPSIRSTLEPRLAELKDYQEDTAAADVFKRAHKIAVLDGKWEDAIASINGYIEDHPGARRRGLRVVDELEAKWLEKRRAIFHRVKSEEFSRAIRKFIATRSPDIEGARSWATTHLEKEVLDRIRARLNMTREEAEEFAQSKAPGAPHWATYEGGSFVISKRAKVGSSSKRQIRGDPGRWWDKYDSDTRAGWLRAYAAERLKLFEVVRINLTDCSRCGGKGQVKKMSMTGLADGRHEWNEVCPRCFGARQDRAVAYK